MAAIVSGPPPPQSNGPTNGNGQSSPTKDGPPPPPPAPPTSANGTGTGTGNGNGHGSGSVPPPPLSAGAGAGPGAAGTPGITSSQKIYIGGLPPTTRQEDLKDCFSQLGVVRSIELKKGYGFVEYEETQAATDAVAKYHEGHFLGSQIKVELSHGGKGRVSDPEGCYNCGIVGHWARNCTRDLQGQAQPKRRSRRSLSPTGPNDDRWGRPLAVSSANGDQYAPRAPPPPASRDDNAYGRRNERDFAPQPARRGDDYRRPPAPPLDRAYDRGYDDDRRYARHDLHSRGGGVGGGDLRDRVDQRGLPPPMPPPGRDYGPPPPSRDHYDDYRRGGPPGPPADPYYRGAPPMAAGDSYGYPGHARDPYGPSGGSAYAPSPRGYPPPEPAYGRPTTYDARGPPSASGGSYGGRYDERPPPMDERDRRGFAERPPVRDDRRDSTYARERSPMRRPMRRSPSPPRRGGGTMGPQYGNPGPQYGNASYPPGPPPVRGGPPMDDYPRRGPPMPYPPRDPYGPRR